MQTMKEKTETDLQKEDIQILNTKEILLEADGEGTEASFNAAAFEEGFDFTLDEFAEVQDLLLADPVHEVDVEQGWPILKDDE